MLNWRRDPGYEQRKMQSEWRMKQLESEIEQLRRENARLKALNAKGRAEVVWFFWTAPIVNL
jgi:hypothetical protein